MPYDSHGLDDDDDKDRKGADLGTRRRFGDFDCPTCNANNPWDDGFGDGDEIRCFYCGEEFKVLVTEEGRLRLREA
jgi:hypothetical protein